MARYVWVFGSDSRAVGVWVPGSLLQDSNLDNILKMAVSMESTQIKNAGHGADRAGFGVDLYAAFAERRYRTVRIQRTVVANNVTFEGGAFLMLGEGRAPSESADPAVEWEVRNNGGQPNLMPRRRAASTTATTPAPASTKKWWQFWR